MRLRCRPGDAIGQWTWLATRVRLLDLCHSASLRGGRWRPSLWATPLRSPGKGLLMHRTTLGCEEVRMHAVGTVAGHVLRHDIAAVPCKQADRKDQAMTGELKRYRKKPVVITARGPLTEAEDIATLEGTMHADVGDYVITGVKGERYPCKPDIFRATYDPA